MTTYMVLRVFLAYLEAIGLGSLALHWVTPQLPAFTGHQVFVLTILGCECVRRLVEQQFIGLTEPKASSLERTHQKT